MAVGERTKRFLPGQVHCGLSIKTQLRCVFFRVFLSSFRRPVSIWLHCSVVQHYKQVPTGHCIAERNNETIDAAQVYSQFLLNLKLSLLQRFKST